MHNADRQVQVFCCLSLEMQQASCRQSIKSKGQLAASWMPASGHPGAAGLHSRDCQADFAAAKTASGMQKPLTGEQMYLRAQHMLRARSPGLR